MKTAFTIFITALWTLLVVTFYFPFNLGAVGPGLRNPRPKWMSEKTAPNMSKKNSIAGNLGVTPPRWESYRPFDPANITKQKKKMREIFAVPQILQAEVNFWKDIYTKYDKTKVVFHDKKYLDIIYSVIDVGDIVKNSHLTDQEKTDRKEDRVETERLRLVSILKTLDGKRLEEMTSEEQKIAKMFEKISDPDKFTAASKDDRLRSQTGIKDKFVTGIAVSGRYLGEMEKIFTDYNIPLEITRLAFVESTFNLNALSKVGASGIWQFMPSTGKLFLTINQTVDERNDPILATHAAAKHLLRDYGILNSWPLAINAYNTGRGRMEQAVRSLGTHDISKIIKEFEGGGYQFASRNFYPAFLAALDAFENREKYFGKIEMEEPLKFDVIEIPYVALLPELAEYTGTNMEELALLNFHLQDSVKSGAVPLPAGFLLKVPEGRGEDYLMAINELEQLNKYAKWHTVKAGEGLPAIAAQYGTTPAKLKQMNSLNGNRLTTGQILKIPERTEVAKE